MTHKRKILTVLLLSAGCGTTSAPAKQTPTSAAEVPVPTMASASTTPAAPMTPAAVAQPTPREPAPDAELPQALIELRGALYGTERDPAHAASARFRPLCDAEGYPLVGNVANKGERYDVSEYCADLRTTLPRHGS